MIGNRLSNYLYDYKNLIHHFVNFLYYKPINHADFRKDTHWKDYHA